MARGAPPVLPLYTRARRAPAHRPPTPPRCVVRAVPCARLLARLHPLFPRRSDGSDELPAPGAPGAPGGKCTNTCDADGASWRQAQAEAIRKSEEGALRRQAYVTEAADAMRARDAKIAEADLRAAALRSEREAAVRS